MLISYLYPSLSSHQVCAALWYLPCIPQSAIQCNVPMRCGAGALAYCVLPLPGLRAPTNRRWADVPAARLRAHHSYRTWVSGSGCHAASETGRAEVAALSLEDLTCGHRRTLSLEGLQVNFQPSCGSENDPHATIEANPLLWPRHFLEVPGVFWSLKRTP